MSEDHSFDMAVDQPLSETPRASVPTAVSTIENPLPGSSGVVVPSQSKYH